VLIERAFSKFNTATQQLFRVHGICNLAFLNIPQMYYWPRTIKKAVTGNDKAKKEELQEKLKELYPDLQYKNLDESDSMGLMHYYKNYINGGIKDGK
jgi:Holliday junction resolvasome RuvABC endonuclease subunit